MRGFVANLAFDRIETFTGRFAFRCLWTPTEGARLCEMVVEPHIFYYKLCFARKPSRQSATG